MKRTELERAVFESGRTRREIAQACGINPSYFSQMLKGKHAPKITMALRLAHELNADPAKLFNGGVTDE